MRMEERHAVWQRHWGLKSDPFPDRDSLFVPLPGHQEAVARLVHAIEAGHRLAVLTGASGLGKTRVLFQALDRGAHAVSPLRAGERPRGRGIALRRAGRRLETPSRDRKREPLGLLRALEQAIRICGAQDTHAVLAVDDSQTLIVAGGTDDLRRLAQLGAVAGGPVTVLLVDGRADRSDQLPETDWTLAVRLKGLTRTEVEAYLAARLAAAGGTESPFTGRAIARLHLLSDGVPRGTQSARLAVPDGGSEPGAGSGLLGAGRRRRRRMPPPLLDHASSDESTCGPAARSRFAAGMRP